MGETIQAGGKDGRKGDADGVSDAKPGSAGESAGGAYPNPHTGKDGDQYGHGGQSEIDYHGPDNANATTGD